MMKKCLYEVLLLDPRSMRFGPLLDVLEGCDIYLRLHGHMATHALARTPMPHAHDAPTQPMPPRTHYPAPKRKHDPALLVWISELLALKYYCRSFISLSCLWS